MVARPVFGSAPGGVAAAPIAMRGETAVKVTPWMRGSFTPMKRPMPADWMMVAMPQVSRSALMRWTSVWLSSPRPEAMTSGTTTAPA